MTSPPRQYTRVAYQPYQRPASPPKQFQTADGTTYIQPQAMQQIPHHPPEQPQPPQDFLAVEHPEQQLPSIEQPMQDQPQRVPEAFGEFYQPQLRSLEEQKLPTAIGQESEQKLSEPEESESEAEDDEWKNQDYVNRCLCGLPHNDDFQVECDRCK